MTYANRSTLAYLLSILAVPILFFGIVIGWFAVEHLLASREVSRFIREHQGLVAKRLTDPRVHSFRLSQDARDRGTLVIHFDVEDKATYEMLEADLDGIWSLRSPPRWETTMRGKEGLANNFGYAAWGLGLLYQGMMVMGIAAIASLVLPGVVLAIALHRIRRRSMQSAG